MQAIITKYLGPTQHRWIRYKAECPAGSLTVPQDDNLNPEENHRRAARLLIEKLEWFHDDARGDTYGRWYCGGVASGGYVFVCADPHAELTKDGAK